MNEQVYVVQQEGGLHIDSIWEKLSFAEDRETELNKDSVGCDYAVVEVTLNEIIEYE